MTAVVAFAMPDRHTRLAVWTELRIHHLGTNEAAARAIEQIRFVMIVQNVSRVVTRGGCRNNNPNGAMWTPPFFSRVLTLNVETVAVGTYNSNAHRDRP